MSRLEQLLKFVDRSGVGVEVAPYFNPALPKAAGHSVLTLDVFDTETLRAYAAKDPLIAMERLAEIEPVDIVGDASSIGERMAERGLAGQLAFVISSHNFEHLPNPIKFLQGCSAALRPGGMLSMAVPDYRACFDHFRLPTRLADWLLAHRQQSDQPTPEQLLDYDLNRCAYMADGVPLPSCTLGRDDPAGFVVTGDLGKAFGDYQRRVASDQGYQDAHCTVMFPETLELMLRDLRQVGLIDLEVVEISQTIGHEFFVHLRKPLADAALPEEAGHQARRVALLRLISQKLGAAPYTARGGLRSLPDRLIKMGKSWLSALIGADRYARIRAANRERRRRRRV